MSNAAFKPTTHIVDVEGREVTLTNLAKILYPKAGYTKADVIDYYVRAAPVIVPHLKGRPLNLKRYPHGVEAEFFFQKQAPVNRPKWLQTVSVPSESRGEPIDFCLANDTPSLVWLVNTGNIEFHSFLAKGSDVERPTSMVFDLDPGPHAAATKPGAGLQHCCQVALWVRDELKGLGLESVVKVSGGKGMQVYAPLNTKVTYDATRTVALAIAMALEQAYPKDVVSKMRKDIRKGKVLIDYSQNARHKSTVAVHSMRANQTPTVSAPLRWSEVESGADGPKAAARLRFSPDDGLRRVRRHGDLFAVMLTKKQKLPAVGP